MSTSKRQLDDLRPRDWIFTALWSAAGDITAPKCTLHVPLTFLFQDTLPYKVLMTDEIEERVLRVPFEEIVESTLGEFDRSNIRVVLNTMKKLLIDCSRESGYDNLQRKRLNFLDKKHEPLKMSTAYYKDGEKEHLDLRTFDLLIGNPEWRKQLVLLQVYVPHLSTQKGYYSERPKIRSKIDTIGSEAADLATKALAVYTENAYKSSASKVITGNKSSNFDSSAKLVVRELEVEYALDLEDRLVLLQCHHCKVVMTNSKQVITSKEAADNELKTAVDTVSTDLLKLLRYARNSGLTSLESFHHFDTKRNGFIDVDSFVDGLTRLGIGVIHQVAETLLERIGGLGTAFITMSDLDKYINNAQDLEAFEFSGTNAKSLRALSRQSRFSDRVHSASQQDRHDDLLDSRTGESKRRRPPRDTIINLQKVNPIGRLPPLSHTPGFDNMMELDSDDEDHSSLQLEEHEQSGWSVDDDGKAKFGGFDNGDAFDGHRSSLSEIMDPRLASKVGMFGAPMTPDQYRVLGKETAGNTMDLPPWAYKRHKKALRELQQAHARWVENKEGQIPDGDTDFNSANMNLSMSLNINETGSLDENDHAMKVAASMSLPSPQALKRKNKNHHHRPSTSERSSSSHSTHRPDSQQSHTSSKPGSRATSHRQHRRSHVLQPKSADTDDDHGDSDSRDEYLHVINGVMMCFRLIKGIGFIENKTEEKLEILKSKSILEVRQQNLAMLEKERLEKNDQGAAPDFADISGYKSREELEKLEQNGISFGSMDFTTTTTTTTTTKDMNSTMNSNVSTENKFSSPFTYNYTSVDPGTSKTLERNVGFTLVITPDLFMSLDTLEQAFSQILIKYPMARLILVSLPGGPNTTWPDKTVLTNEVRARALAKLMRHLRKQRRLTGLRGEPIFFIACGTSAPAVSLFAASHLQALPWLNTITACIIIVSGFLQMSKGLKRTLTDLRDLMWKTNQNQINEQIMFLHFWDEYLVSTGRHEVLESFWSTRRGLQWDKHKYSEEHIGRSYKGVLSTIQGLLESESDADQDPMQLLQLGLPVLSVHGLEDRFVDPRHVGVFQPEKLPEARTLVDDIDLCANPDSVHVTWLNCGHEILQERSPYMLALISHLAQLKGMKPEDEWQLTEEVESDDEEYDVLAIKAAKERALREAEERHEAARQQRLAKEERERLAREAEEDRLAEEYENLQAEKDRLLAEEEAKELKKKLGREEIARLAREAEEEELRLEEERKENKKRSERQAQERKKRGKLAAERKRREAEAQRNAALEILYEMVQQWNEEKWEQEELKEMAEEDKRSYFKDEYIKQIEMLEHNNAAAYPKRLELQTLRKDEARRAVEHRLAIKKSQMIEERRQKAEALVQEILSEKLILPGMEAGGYDIDETIPDIVAAMSTATQRLLQDLMKCRQEIVESLQRNKLVQQKTDLFKNQVDSVRNDIAALRRTLRVLEREPELFGDDGDAQKAKIEEVKSKIAYKEETFLELKALSKGRFAQLRAANRSVQIIKIEMAERDRMLEDRIAEMKYVESQKKEVASKIKRDREFLVAERDQLIIDKKMKDKRLLALRRELKRIEKHKGDLVDTDVWVAGVLQRARTKELIGFLDQEISAVTQEIDSFKREIDVKIEEIWTAAMRTDKARREADKISMIAQVFDSTLRRLRATPVSQLLKDTERRQDKAKTDTENQKAQKKTAMNVEKKKKKTNENDSNGNDDNDVDDASSTSSGGDTIANEIRAKDSQIRSRDERKFIGMDIVLNPDMYEHLSVTEAEEMQFDPDYQCELDQLVLRKIINLPDQISLAAPFLHGPKEFEAHRILNMYCKGYDEDYYRELDIKSGDASGVLHEGESDSDEEDEDEQSKIMKAQGVKGSDLSKAEYVMDILLRESRRNRLRSMGPGDHYTQEEIEWCAMDRILSPHVYGKQELRFGGPKNGTDLHSSVIPPGDVRRPHLRGMFDGDMTNKHDEAREGYPVDVPYFENHTNRDGDMFQDMRWRYEEGEDVFDYSWQCPFSREKLLEIDKSQIDLLKDPDERHAKERMTKYFVREDESDLGRRRIEGLNEVKKYVDAISDDGKKHHHHHHGQHSSSTHPHAKKEDERHVKRLWGGWTLVHPASAGTESQVDLFDPTSYSCYRDHPASHAVYEPPVIMSAFDEEKHGHDALFDSFVNDPKSKWFIVSDLKELSTTEQRRVKNKTILLGREDILTMFDLPNASLNSRSNTSYRFDIPDDEDKRILDISVEVEYWGTYGTKGQYVGRLAVGLYRLPDESNPDESPMPKLVGFAPYELQKPNHDDQHGRMLILHRPKHRPIKPTGFQIVVGASTPTTYKIKVKSRYAQSARPVLDRKIQNALEMQSRLPQSIKELEVLDLSLRLAERKLLLCDKLMEEVKNVIDEKHDHMIRAKLRLHRNETEDNMTADEIRYLTREIGILEVEYAEASETFSSRWRERQEIKVGINMMHVFQRQRHNEKKKIKNDLELARQDLPACMVLMDTLQNAAKVAADLNTTFRAGGMDSSNEEATIPIVSTPADDVRRAFRRNGWDSLSVDEQKWSIMDMEIKPMKYDWLQEQDDEDKRQAIRLGMDPPKRINKVGVDDFKLHRSEIEHILVQPYDQLNRREMQIRKLFGKFHDSMDKMIRQQQAHGSGFDKHLAERTRAKNPQTYTKDDKSWISLDKVLHPEIWAYYVHDDDERTKFTDRAAKEATASYDFSEEGSERGRSPRKSKKGKSSKSSSKSPDKKKKDKDKKKDRSPSPDTKKKGGWFGGISSITSGAGKMFSRSPSPPTKEEKAKAKAEKKEQKRLEEEAKIKREAEIKAREERNRPWINPFDRYEIMDIWRTADKRYLNTDDERECYKLLMKYNGPWSLKVELDKQKAEREKNKSKAGAHINFDHPGQTQTQDVDLRSRQLLLEIDRARTTQNEWMDTNLLHASKQRFPTHVLRMQLEEELDNILKLQITERERQDRVRLSVRMHEDEDSDDEKEKEELAGQSFFGRKQEGADDDDTSQDGDDGSKSNRNIESREKEIDNMLFPPSTAGSEAYGLDGTEPPSTNATGGGGIGTAASGAVRTIDLDQQELPISTERPGTGGSNGPSRPESRGTVSSDISPSKGRPITAPLNTRHGIVHDRPTPHVGGPGHEESTLGSEMTRPMVWFLHDLRTGVYGAVAAAGSVKRAGEVMLRPTGINKRDERIYRKVQRRSEGREQRRLKLKTDTEYEEVHKVRKMVKLTNKTGDALELAKLQNRLGAAGCVACKRPSCIWRPYTNIDKCKKRIVEIDDELERVRLDPDRPVWVSDVPMEAKAPGGNHLYKREDLIQVLMKENMEQARRIDLTNIDQEFHDSVKNRSDYIEVKHLHGYSVVMWAKGAREALQMRHNQLIAINVAEHCVDDILDSMLEGWYFGEVDISQTTDESLMKKVEERGLAKKKADNRPDKDLDLIKISDLKVARDGNVHERKVNAIEGNLRFGLFLIAIMYFRAMTYLKKEERDKMMKEAAYASVVAKRLGGTMSHEHHAGQEGDGAEQIAARQALIAKENANEAREKKIKMILSTSMDQGAARKKAREEEELDIAKYHLQELIRRQKLERDKITDIQRCYRGHLHRKVSKRWALKKYEMDATHALFTGAAICAQRHWRGYMGRELTRRTRDSMANFIALQRLQETADDEEAFWDTHPYQRIMSRFNDWRNQGKRDNKTYEVVKEKNDHKMEVIQRGRDFLEKLEAEEEAKSLEEDEAVAQMKQEATEMKERLGEDSAASLDMSGPSLDVQDVESSTSLSAFTTTRKKD